jgi:hypothetical protein
LSKQACGCGQQGKRQAKSKWFQNASRREPSLPAPTRSSIPASEPVSGSRKRNTALELRETKMRRGVVHSNGKMCCPSVSAHGAHQAIDGKDNRIGDFTLGIKMEMESTATDAVV